MNDPQNEPRTCPYCDKPRQDTFEHQFRFECGTSLRRDDHKTVKQTSECKLRVAYSQLLVENCKLKAALKAEPQPVPLDRPGWRPGPAQGGAGTHGPCTEKFPSGTWNDGDCLLVVVNVHNNKTGDEWTEYHAVRISCDEHFFNVEGMWDGNDPGWEPDSWEWYMVIPDLPATPPPAPKEEGVG